MYTQKDNKKSNKKKVLAIIVFVTVAAVVAVGIFFGLKWYLEQENNQTTGISADGFEIVNNVKIGEIPTSKWNVPPNNPKYMSIPSIGVNKARVENLGIKAGTKSQMDDPVYSMDAGWYNQSARPGDGHGAGLYDGHFGVGAYKAVFSNLYQAGIGDSIVVERGDGKKFTYIIVENVTIPVKKVKMSEVMMSFDENKEGLSIITCGGTWDVAKQAYDKRTIIRAVIK